MAGTSAEAAALIARLAEPVLAYADRLAIGHAMSGNQICCAMPRPCLTALPPACNGRASPAPPCRPPAPRWR